MGPMDLDIKITDFDLSSFAAGGGGGGGSRLHAFLPRVGHPGMRYMLRANPAAAAAAHSPPEHAIVAGRDMRCAFNVEWLSRMMAFELLGAIGEMFGLVAAEPGDAVAAAVRALVGDVTGGVGVAAREIGGQCLCVPMPSGSATEADVLARHRPTTAQVLRRLVALAMSVGALPRRDMPGLTAVPIAECALLGSIIMTDEF